MRVYCFYFFFVIQHLGLNLSPSLVILNAIETGGERISLIDADKIEEKNLNRIFCFCQKNIDTPKVETLKKKLESINPNINVNTHQWNLKEQDHCIEDKDKRKNIITRFGKKY